MTTKHHTLSLARKRLYSLLVLTATGIVVFLVWLLFFVSTGVVRADHTDETQGCNQFYYQAQIWAFDNTKTIQAAQEDPGIYDPFGNPDRGSDQNREQIPVRVEPSTSPSPTDCVKSMPDPNPYPISHDRFQEKIDPESRSHFYTPECEASSVGPGNCADYNYPDPYIVPHIMANGVDMARISLSVPEEVEGQPADDGTPRTLTHIATTFEDGTSGDEDDWPERSINRSVNFPTREQVESMEVRPDSGHSNRRWSRLLFHYADCTDSLVSETFPNECPTYYDYRPVIDDVFGDPDQDRPKPGQTIEVETIVSNEAGTENDPGPDYTYSLEITEGEAYVSTSDDLDGTNSGIPPQGSDSIDFSFEIDGDAPDDEDVCFELTVSPAEGNAGGTTYVEERSSVEECITIYNLQFEVDDIWIDSLPDTVRQGETHTIEVNVQNAGDINAPPPPINNAGTEGGTTHDIETTLDIWVKEVDDDTWTRADGDTSTLDVDYDTDRQVISYDYTVPNYDYDIIICPVAYVEPVSGWSDGSSWNPWSSGSAPFYEPPVETNYRDDPILDECDEMRVVDSPYFQVQRNDVHSGVSFAPTGNPILGCEQPDSGDRGFISAHRNSNENFGSLSEYAGYGTGVVDGFGTSAVSTNDSGSNSLSLESFFTSDPMNDRLTFANTTGGGQLGPGATRCIANLFGLLAQGGDDVESLGLSEFNLNNQFIPPRSDEDSQFFRDGDLTIRQDANPNATNRRVTIVVDGDVTIARNISPHRNDNTYRGNNLTIIARNINISESVTHIDALLYAIPEDDDAGEGTSGIVDTCYEHDSLDTNICDNQLVFRGAVFADRLDLKRTYGSLDPETNSPENDVDEPAEVFRYSPVHILRHPYFVFADDVPRPELPTQQMIDLPPRF